MGLLQRIAELQGAELTTIQKLEMVQTAMANILMGAQSYTTSGRTVTRADLPELRKYEKELKSQLNVEQGKTGRNYAKFIQSV
jgi:hypothetical protein